MDENTGMQKWKNFISVTHHPEKKTAFFIFFTQFVNFSVFYHVNKFNVWRKIQVDVVDVDWFHSEVSFNSIYIYWK